MNIIWAVLFIVVAAIGLVALARLLMESRARVLRNPELEAKFESAGFRVTSSPFGAPEITGTLHETTFVLTATPGAKGTPAMTTIRVPNSPGVSFAITREGSRDLSGHDQVESMFPDVRTREAVRALFGSGFDTIMLSGGNLKAIRTFKAELLHTEALSVAIEQLAVIRAATGVQAAPDWRVPPQSSTRIVAASTALLIAGFLLFHIGGRAKGMAAIRDFWPGMAAGCLVLALLAVLILRGRPLAGGEIGFIVFMALPGLFLGACGIVMIAS